MALRPSLRREPNPSLFPNTSIYRPPSASVYRQPNAPYYRPRSAQFRWQPSASFGQKPKVSLRRKGWSDWPFAKVLLVWVAFGFSVIFYFSDWPQTRKHTPTVQVSRVSGADAEELYTGSIVVGRAGGTHCWERKFDNRTGAMSGKDMVNCGKGETQETDSRMRVLRDYFRKR